MHRFKHRRPITFLQITLTRNCFCREQDVMALAHMTTHPLPACLMSRVSSYPAATALSMLNPYSSLHSMYPAQQLHHRMLPWPSGMPGRGNLKSRSRILRSWVPSRGGWDVWEAILSWRYHWRLCRRLNYSQQLLFCHFLWQIPPDTCGSPLSCKQIRMHDKIICTLVNVSQTSDQCYGHNSSHTVHQWPCTTTSQRYPHSPPPSQSRLQNYTIQTPVPFLVTKETLGDASKRALT